jgi:antitoxin component YwqK of YwqJK toxin-antitoxin module
VGQRATSALNGMLMGAIIGGQAGPFGAAAGAAIFLVYSAVTGNVPLMGGGGGGYGYPGGGGGGYGYPGGQERDREQSLEDQIQNEEQRQASLESEIEEEQKRQDELLKKIDGQGTPQSAKVEPIPDRDAAPTDQELREQSDPRMAPSAPKERSLPASVYQEQKIQVAPGKWGNDKPLEVKRRSLDADRDGKSEEIVYVDARSGQILRKENDLDYDGTTDAWSTYQNGMCVAREVDSDRNGKIDTWETYAGGRMQSREVDRNGDGVRDAFFRYDGDSLAEERHDGNNDGQIDLVITYAGRHRVRSEEDANKDGKMDVWTTFSVGDGSNEVITRIEKDQKGTGKADTFETYVQQEGRAVLSSREEDVNGDGQVDVKSSYENGKLKNREISDPSLVPL